MSKRPLEETREERWLRKLKSYEEKIAAKRVRRADQPQNVPASMHEEDVQTERPEYSEAICEQDVPYAEYSLAGDDVSQMSETSAGSPASITENDIIVEIEDDDYDPDLLRELGTVDMETAEFGEDLQTTVAQKLQKVLLEGLKKEVKDELLKKYPFPKNVPLSKGPSLNPEIGAMLADACKLRDSRLLSKQDQLGKALSALGKALTGLLKKTPDIRNIIHTLTDTATILADSHFLETDTRRSVIMPLIDKSMAEAFKDRKRDAFLFGAKLGEMVKDSRGIKKTSELLQVASNYSNLNRGGPSPRRPRNQRGGQAYHRRAGGPRAAAWAPSPQYPSRRRAAPPPPPPAPRQYRPPPPPGRRPPPAAPRPSTSRQT